MVFFARRNCFQIKWGLEVKFDCIQSLGIEKV
jgi:hypothetical protein